MHFMKKVVHYLKLHHAQVGSPAVIEPFDHPDKERVTNAQVTLTSTVERLDEKTGEFETEFSLYRPLPVLTDVVAST